MNLPATCKDVLTVMCAVPQISRRLLFDNTFDYYNDYPERARWKSLHAIRDARVAGLIFVVRRRKHWARKDGPRRGANPLCSSFVSRIRSILSPAWRCTVTYLGRLGRFFKPYSLCGRRLTHTHVHGGCCGKRPKRPSFRVVHDGAGDAGGTGARHRVLMPGDALVAQRARDGERGNGRQSFPARLSRAAR